ncbi:MAG: filamentous hemagglutinin N-terminal domain-containing protein [Sideroxydans sp.]|nr:filamentous hemagglutinin N-terminal domain-containing protein [Sideroxydans sp.]
MNHIYRLIWSHITNAWVAVAENVKGRGKTSSGRKSRIVGAVALTGSVLVFGFALAAPTGGQITAGSGNITASGSNTTINQGSQNLAINWQSFGIAANELVRFNQPNASSIALNRVVGQDASQILGSLSANGQVFILNPNGVLFGQGSQVNVGGLVATTQNLSNTDFMAGKYSFSGNGSNASVVNQGTLTATDGGYIALLAPEVRNEGVISARLGTALLAAGDKVTLQINNGSLLSFNIDQGALKALVDNKQLIVADGGQVFMSAKAADALSTAVVNNTGVIQAHTIQNINGTIKLIGDMQVGTVNVGGTLDASASTTGNGGFIETSAAHVKVADDVHITTASTHGLTGSWLIDPNDFTIAASGGDISGATLGSQLGNNSVTIQSANGATTGNGDIFVKDNVSWSANNTLTLHADRNIHVLADITGSGTSSKVALEYGQGTVNAGNTSTYDFGLTSTGFTGRINLQAGNNFSTKLGSDGAVTNYTVITALGTGASAWRNDGTLQGIGGNLGGNYVLGANIDATGTTNWSLFNDGFIPLGDSNQPFTGTFNGLGHTIGNLYINTLLTGSSVGLFSKVAANALVSNVGLVNVYANGHLDVGGLAGTNFGTISNSYATGNVLGDYDVGGLVGSNSGTISNSYATDRVAGQQYFAGGLVGSNSGTISNSSATGNVTGNYDDVGGLAGNNSGSISNSYATGNVTNFGRNVGGLAGASSGIISNSYATGNITGNVRYAGGLVGYSQGTISHSYATGSVSGNADIGGLVGFGEGTISNSYATGSVSGRYGDNVGGLMGSTGIGTISNSYATGNVSSTGGNSVGGLVGRTGIGTIISNSYATGNVTGSLNYVGGLVGLNFGTMISNSYATGSVTGDIDGVGAVGVHNGRGDYTGGLVGGNYGAISNSYASGSVTGNVGHVGGLVGGNNTLSTISSSYWNTDTSGLISAGGTGLTSAQMQNTANFVGFNFTTTPGAVGNNWVMVDADGTLNGSNGAVRPMLASEYSTTITNAHQLQLMAMDMGAYYTLAANINATGTSTGNDVWNSSGFVSVGNSVSNFNGSFDGQNHTISNLSIYGADNVGLFGVTGASSDIRNLGLVGGVVGGGNSVGTLVGQNSGSIRNVYTSGSVTGTANVGALVGYNSGGSINDVYATSRVAGTNSVGGLVGYSWGSISNAYATGSVNGWTTVGGLVGQNSGSISDSYATGTVVGTMFGNGNVGGLVGQNDGSIRDSYATGTVGGVMSGYGNIGGLVGFNNSGSVSNSYWNTTTSSQATSAGGTGLTSADMQQQSSFTGFDFTNTWVIYDGHTDPLLRAFMTNLTVTANDASKTYDGQVYNGNDGVSYSTAPNSNLLGSVAYSGDKNAGTHAITLSGLYSNQQGYIIRYVDGTETVAQKAVSVSGITASNKIYDGGTSATVDASGASIAGLISGDVVSVSSSGSFVDKNVATGKTVTLASTFGGADGGNYLFTGQASTTADITQKAVSVSSITASNKTYDGTTAATVSTSGANIAGLVSGDTVNINATGSFGDKNVGNSKTVTLASNYSGADAGNYLITDQASTTANIARKDVTVSGLGAANKTYDATTAATLTGTAAITGGANGANDGKFYSSDAVTVAGTAAGSFLTKNTGAGKSVIVTGNTLAGTDAGNYNLVQQAGLTADIAKANIIITGLSAANKTYDATIAATVTGTAAVAALGSDSVTVGGTAVGAFVDKNVGTSKAVNIAGLSLSGADAGNYNVGLQTGITADIGKADLAVTGLSASSKTYDATTTAALTGSAVVTAFSGDSVTVGGTAVGAFFDKNAGTGKVVSVTGNTLSGTDAGNYNIVQQTGLTTDITKKDVAVSGLTANNKTYDAGTVATLGGTAALVSSDIISGDSLTIGGTATGAFADKNVSTAKAVTVTGNTLSGTDAGNYHITQQTGLTANISKANLAVTGLAASNRTYDATTTVTLTGTAAVNVLGTDSVTVGGTAVGAFFDKNAGTGKVVSVTGNTLSGTDAGNYNIVQQTGLTTDITKKDVAVSGLTANNKTYDAGTVATLGGTAALVSSDIISGDSLTIGGTATGAFADKNVSTAKAVTVTGNTLSGTDAGNYHIIQQTGITANITPASLTLSGTRVYDTSTTVAGSVFTATGVAGETFTLTGAGDASNLTSKNVQTASPLASVTGLALGSSTNGGLTGNYTLLSTVGSSVSITPAPLTVTGLTASNKVYDGTTAVALTGTGAVTPFAGDSVNLASTANSVFADKNVGVGKTVLMSVYGADAGNYVFSPLTADITPLASVAWTGASGNWSNAANWAGGVIPEGIGNVLAVTIPTGVTVTYDSGVAGATSLNTLTSSGNLAMSAGALAVTGNVNTVGYSQTGGVFSVGGNMNVSQSFTKASGATGSLVMTGANSLLNIHQSVGNLSFYNDQTIHLGAVSASGDMLFSTSAGDITLSAPLAWSANNVTLSAANNVNINAVMTASNTASLDLEAGGSVNVGLGPNGFVGHVNFVQADGSTPRSGTGFLTINTHPYTVINSLGAAGSTTGADLQGMNLNLAGYYALGANIDASATSGWNGGGGFSPIGASYANAFTGSFDGLGHTVTNLAINRPATTRVGLFGFGGANSAIRNVGMVGGSVTGRTYVGSLMGNTEGAVSNSYATGNVSGADIVGGLVGQTSGAISHSHATGQVSGTMYVGGLVGRGMGTINGYATGDVTGTSYYTGGLVGMNYGSINGAYATGVVRGGSYVGGLTGMNYGQTIRNSYATGNVSGTGYAIGGLAGGNGSAQYNPYASIDNSYATGSVSGGSYAGKLVGFNGGTINNSFWESSVSSGLAGWIDAGGTASNTTGLTGSQWTQMSNFSNWSIANTGGSSAVWRIYEGNAGNVGPLLRDFLTALTVTADTGSRSYDGGTTALGVSYSATPNANLLGTASTTLDGKNVGSHTAMASGLYSNQQGYDVSYVDGTVNVTPKSVSVSGITASNKSYDTTTAVTVSTSGANIAGLISGDTVNVNATGAFQTKDAGTAKTVTLSSSYSGADVGNYLITDQATASADIAKANLAVTGLSASNKTYDATTSATLSGVASVAALGSDSVSVSGTAVGTFVDKNVGTAKAVAVAGLSISGADAGNYNVGQQTGITADISKADLAVTGLSASSKTYDATTNVTLTGATSVTALNGDSVTLGGTATGAFADKSAGTGKAVTVSGNTLTGTDAGNYSLVQQSGLTADISKADLAVTGLSASSKTYDASTVATLTGTATVAALGGDSVTLGGTAIGAFADKNAGTGKAVTVSGNTLAGTDAGNYNLIQQTGLNADISKADLAVTGLSASSKEYDATTVATLGGTAAVTALGNDSVSVSGSAIGSFANKNVGTAKAVTVAGNTLSGTDAGNYNLVQQTGLSADISKANITIVGLSAASKTYDATTTATLTGTAYVAALGSDSVSVSGTAVGTFVDKNAGTGKGVNVAGLSLGGADAGNYNVGQQTSITADIAPKSVSVSGISASNKTYDGTTTATVSTTSANIAGLVSGDTVTVSATGTFADKNVANGKTVALSSNYSGADAGNYSFTDQASTTADIAQKALTVSATGVNKVYDGGTVATVTLSDNRVVGDVLSLSDSSASFSDKNVGTSKSVNVSGINVSGTDAGNYTFNTAAATNADIAPKSVSVSGITASNKTYDGTATASLGGIAALVAGDIVSGDSLNIGGTAVGSFATASVGNHKPVTVMGNTLSGADAGNYRMVQQTGLTADIIAAPTSGNVPGAVASAISALSGGDGLLLAYQATQTDTANPVGMIGETNMIIAMNTTEKLTTARDNIIRVSDSIRIVNNGIRFPDDMRGAQVGDASADDVNILNASFTDILNMEVK